MKENNEEKTENQINKENKGNNQSEKEKKKEETTENQSEKMSEKEEEKSEKKSDEKTCEEKLTEANDKYIRLVAEFDNYRKRTSREKLDILRNGSEEVIKGLLPILDDFDRGVKLIQEGKDIDAIKDGILLIQNKLITFLKSEGLTEIEAQDKELDTDLHDAITKFPVDDKNKKGKIIDVAQKGYKLNDKVIRFAKVIVGE